MVKTAKVFGPTCVEMTGPKGSVTTFFIFSFANNCSFKFLAASLSLAYTN